MISVVQGDLQLLSQYYPKPDQVLQAAKKDNIKQEIRAVLSKALKSAVEQGLKTLMLPVVNTRGPEILVEEIAHLMVSEARKYMSLHTDLKELTFVLPDMEGVQAFREIINRKKIVCLGDSITYGYPDGPDFSWVTKVVHKTGYQMLNRGINGETTGQMLSRLQIDVITEKPSYLIFAGGHNDSWQQVPLQRVRHNIQQVVEGVLHQGICPILVSPSPLNIEQLLQSYEGTRRDAEDYHENLSQIRQWIYQYAREKEIFTLDFYTPLLLTSKDQGDPRYLLDGGHPTHEGYSILGEAAIQQLAGRLHL
ncbi:hypothetical protein JCM14036_16110 [Desulfotomaculum defluvii]